MMLTGHEIPLDEAPRDADKAAECLLLIAKRLRDGKPLPSDVAIYLADAFEAAMLKPKEKRAQALVLELNLKALNKRPVNVDPEWLEKYLVLSETKAKKAIAKQYGISETKALDLFKWAKYLNSPEQEYQESEQREYQKR